MLNDTKSLSFNVFINGSRRLQKVRIRSVPESYIFFDRFLGLYWPFI